MSRITDRQYINIPLDVSLMEQTDPKLLPVGSAAVVQNANFNINGALAKRNGFDAITTTFNDKRAIYAHGNELLINADGYLYSYEKGAQVFEQKGSLIPCDVSYRQLSLHNAAIVGTNNLMTWEDIAESNGYQVVLHQDVRVGACLRILEKSTGNLIFEQYATGIPTNYYGVCAIGNTVYVAFRYTGTSISIAHIDMTQVSTYAGISASDVDLPNFYNGADVVDTCVTGDGYMALCYTTNRNSQIRVAKYNITSGLLPTQPTISDATTGQQTIGICSEASGNVYVMWQKVSGEIKTAGYNADLSAKYAPTMLVNPGVAMSNFAGVSYDSNNVLWLFDGYAILTQSSATSPTIDKVITAKADGLATLASTNVYTGVRLATRPFAYNGTFAFGIYYTCPAANIESYQPTYFMVDLNRNIHARILPGEGPFERWGGGFKPSNVIVDGYQVYFMGSRSTTSYIYATGVGSDPSPLPAIVKLDYSGKTSYARHGRNALFGGAGMVREYDGENIYENNFNLFPEFTGYTLTTSHIQPAGTYSIILVWKYLDSNGELSISDTSAPITITFDGSHGAYISYLFLQLTDKPAKNIICCVYMTNKNGSIYYLNNTGTNYIDGIIQEGYITLTSVNTSAETLYTTGNYASNTCPPAARAILESNNRLFIIDSSGTVWFTQPYELGFGADFSTSLSFPTQCTGDGYYSMGEVEGRVVIVSPTQVTQFYGNGPDFTGANNDYVPSIFARNISPNSSSLITTDQGLFYSSGAGLINISRDINVNYIGKPVLSSAANYISSEVFDIYSKELRFTTPNNVILSYNYFTEKWQTFTGISAQDSTIWNGNHTILGSDGYLLIANPASFLDRGNPIQLKIETPWIRLNGLRGYIICWNAGITGTWKSPHYLNYAVYQSDNKSTSVKNGYFDLTAGYNVNDPIFVNLHIGTRSTSVKFVLWDSNQSGTCESFKLNTIDLEIGLEKGIRKLPSGQTQ